MRSDTEHSKLGALVSLFKACGIIFLCGLVLLDPLACRKRSGPTHSSKPSPPDLSRCTHIEVLCQPIGELSIATRFFDPNFLSSAEIDRLQSLKKFVVDDKKTIRDFASQISSGWSYKGFTKENIPIGKPSLRLIFYHNDERIALITMYGLGLIVTENGHWFDYDSKLPNLLLVGPQEIRMLVLRLYCGVHLWALYEEFILFSERAKMYPLPIGWCEMIVRNKFAGRTQDSETSEEEMRGLFICPGAGEGKSHYAMNPNCRPNSPPDTVLLFETKASWNQNGGPELFNFDNHDPKGGCVLLNDGMVKFIRTKEELQQLRWK